jgi:hypothetical protein
LLWATGLWTMLVMLDGVLIPPFPHPLVALVQPIVQRSKETDSETK